MKKLFTLVLAATVLLLTGACSNGGGGTASTDATVITTAGSTVATQPGESSDGERSNILVAYFSCTGNTKTLAEYAAQSLDARLYEILPKKLYTADDLNYNDENSRCSQEHNNPDARPEISGSVSDMAQYDIILLAYPIWWGEAPRILSTFVESYDFAGKTVIPFCTSGSSDIGSSADNLEKLTSGAIWLSGKRFAAGTTQEEMAEWINGLNSDVNITAQ